MGFLLPPRKVRAFLMGMDGSHGKRAPAEEAGRMGKHLALLLPIPVT